MQVKLFVGLTFHQDNSFAKKIQSFRGRYDEKAASNPSVYMPMVAPFEVAIANLDELEEEIAEEVDSFFIGHEGEPRVRFTGVDVHTHAKNNLLYLNPEEGTDLFHCEEALLGICRAQVSDREKMPKADKKFLTIGRFSDPLSLHGALDVAAVEFADCTDLPVKGVCLFRKNMGIWYQQRDLISFDLGKGL